MANLQNILEAEVADDTKEITEDDRDWDPKTLIDGQPDHGQPNIRARDGDMLVAGETCRPHGTVQC